MPGKQPCVYILTSGRNGTLCVGVTSNLFQRVWQHRSHTFKGFTARYGVTRLVWYEVHATMRAAIQRGKQIKEWKRDWKLDLIERTNPAWLDLYDSLRSGRCCL